MEGHCGCIKTRYWELVTINKNGKDKDIMNIKPFVDKWRSFGWHCQKINGHNFDEIQGHFLMLKNCKQISIIIANTIKGKDISFMEDDNWHYRTPNK